MIVVLSKFFSLHTYVMHRMFYFERYCITKNLDTLLSFLKPKYFKCKEVCNTVFQSHASWRLKQKAPETEAKEFWYKDTHFRVTLSILLKTRESDMNSGF